MEKETKEYVGAWCGFTAGLVSGGKAGVALGSLGGPAGSSVLGLVGMVAGGLVGAMNGAKNPAGAAMSLVGTIGSAGAISSHQKQKCS